MKSYIEEMQEESSDVEQAILKSNGKTALKTFGRNKSKGMKEIPMGVFQARDWLWKYVGMESLLQAYIKCLTISFEVFVCENNTLIPPTYVICYGTQVWRDGQI